MGMFDVQFTEELKLKKDKKDLFKYLNKHLSKDKTYEHTIEQSKLTINKNPVDTFLKYNVVAEFDLNTLIIDAELDNSYTLFITVLIILSILFTYGIAIIPVIGFVYFQKIKATRYLKDLLKIYKNLD